MEILQSSIKILRENLLCPGHVLEEQSRSMPLMPYLVSTNPTDCSAQHTLFTLEQFYILKTYHLIMVEEL